MPTTKKLLTFPASDELIDAINEAHKEAKMTRAAFIKMVIADYIGYDLTNEPKAGRPRKYATNEDALKAARQRAAALRKLVQDIVLSVERGEREDDIRAMLRSVQTKQV